MKWKLDPEIHQARVINVEDPLDQGRCRIRVIGTHPSKIPEDELPWAQLSPELGANSGQGKKNIIQKGQFVTVKSVTAGKSEWIITGGSATKVDPKAKPKESKNRSVNRKGKEAEGQNAGFSKDAKNEKLTNDSIPKTASTIMAKLKEVASLQNIIQGLINKTFGTGGQTPVEPKDGYALITYNLDVTDPFIPVTGGTIDISNLVWNDIDGKEVKAQQEVFIELVNSKNPDELKTPGGIKNKHKREIYLESDNRTLNVPADFLFPTYKDKGFSPAYRDIIIDVASIKQKDPRVKVYNKII